MSLHYSRSLAFRTSHLPAGTVVSHVASLSCPPANSAMPFLPRTCSAPLLCGDTSRGHIPNQVCSCPDNRQHKLLQVPLLLIPRPFYRPTSSRYRTHRPGSQMQKESCPRSVGVEYFLIGYDL